MNVDVPVFIRRLSRLVILCLASLTPAVFAAEQVLETPAQPANATTPPAQTDSPSTPYLSPAEELKTIELKPGYSLQLVVSDPVIKEPVVAVFDGNGKMYVAEMRTY